MEDEEAIVLLSSLLHDIGKFSQRALGVNKRHYQYSSEFIDRYIPKTIFSNNIVEEAKQIVNDHHSDKSNYILNIVKNADHISASERDYTDLEREVMDTYKSVYRKLVTPFSKGNYYPLIALSIDARRFIDEINDVENLTNNVYKNHFYNFTREVERLNKIGYEGDNAKQYYIESLLYLMKAWLFTIPSAPYYERIPTISLYEHLRMTMAIAHSLYINKGKGGFYFIWIDIGGIQRFIYNIHPQKALKALRGRSFFVSLLTEAISKYIIHKLGLLECNIITLGGGHALLLLPSSLSDKVDNIIDDVRRFIFEIFGARINLYIGKAYTDDITKLGVIFDNIFNDINKAKRKPLDNILKDIVNYDKIFERNIVGKNTCHICNYDTNNEKDDEDIVKCDICKELEDLAKPLVDASYIVEIIDENVKDLEVKDTNLYTITFTKLGICYMLVNDIDIFAKVIDSIKVLLKRPYIRVYALNTTDILRSKIPYALGFKFLANIVPKKDNDIMSLDDLVKSAKGANLIGILKMDVDNLGEFFKSSNVLSEYSTKSNIIDLFFNGYLNDIADVSSIYTIYAGGDDLFIVGAWDKVIDIAYKIWRYFSMYTSNSSYNTLSAGIVICDEHTPAYIFANEAKEALELSKSRGKNKVTIFGNSISWDVFDRCISLYKEFANAIDNGILSRGSIFALLSTLRDSRINDEPHSVKRYRLLYTITNIKKHNEGALELINKIEYDINAYIKWLDIPLRLAEFATR